MLPLPKWLGRPFKHARRDIVDAILYVVRTGCAWRYLPVDFPPSQTVYGHFKQFNERGTIERILDELREQVRIAVGRAPQPSAGIIDSQSVKGADTVGAPSRRRTPWSTRTVTRCLARWNPTGCRRPAMASRPWRCWCVRPRSRFLTRVRR